MTSTRKLLLATAALSLAALFATPAAAQLYYVSNLKGTNEVPPNASTATGLGCFTVRYDDTTGNYLIDYEISFSGLSAAETGAHIHGPAGPGVNAPVLIPLPLGSPKIGTAPLTAVQYGYLLAGNLYVNIHSTLYPGGEIRDQLHAAPGPCTVATDPTTWGTIKALYR